ncbi:hypothetical protein ACMD2_18355, partial [Ananas comosus]
LLHLTEIADGLLHLASQKRFSQSSISHVRCEANRRGRPRRERDSPPVSRNAKDGDDLKDPPLSNSEASKTSDQDEIISLFRRIRSSIAKGESVAARRRSPTNVKEKPAVKSIQRHPSRKQVRAPREEVEREAALSKFSSSEDEQGKRDSPPPVNTAKLSRPASNFVKRSPIPPPPATRKTNKNAADEHSPTEIRKEASEILKLEELKLVELKELAKEKGVKGYSRLKKGELIELLKGLV